MCGKMDLYAIHQVLNLSQLHSKTYYMVAECSPVMRLGTSCSSEGTNLKFCQLYA